MSINTVSDYLYLLTPTERLNLAPGDFLFNQNDPARGIFVVKQGRIKLLRDTVDGNAVIMYTAQTNDSLAEASLFSSHYHCHAKADLESEVLFYEKTEVLKYFSSNSESALNFIEVLAKQIQRLRLLLELRGVRSPRERFIQYLQLMADSERIVSVQSTYKDLAITLGMTHETLYRVLAQLEKENVVKREENKIILQI